jgi:hypothetical protein
MTCDEFGRGIADYQLDQLGEVERAVFQEHLNGCVACARRLEVEDGFLRVVRAHLRPVAAPPELATRIRARLSQIAPDPGRRAWYREPWAAAIAASTLLALLVLSGSGGAFDASLAGLIEIGGRQALVVDHDCDRAGRPIGEQRRCRVAGHVNVLRIAHGTYWYVSLDDPAVRSRFLEPAMRGHRLVVTGQLYPRIHTLHLERFEDLDPDLLRL